PISGPGQGRRWRAGGRSGAGGWPWRPGRRPPRRRRRRRRRAGGGRTIAAGRRSLRAAPARGRGWSCLVTALSTVAVAADGAAVAAGEGGVADPLAQPGVVGGADQAQVADPGRRRGVLAGLPGPGLGVGVPSDGERDRRAAGLPLVAD